MNRLVTEIHWVLFIHSPSLPCFLPRIFLAPLAMPARSTHNPILRRKPGLHSKLHGAEPVTGPIWANQRWTPRLASRKKRCKERTQSQEQALPSRRTNEVWVQERSHGSDCKWAQPCCDYMGPSIVSRPHCHFSSYMSFTSVLEL